MLFQCPVWLCFAQYSVPTNKLADVFRSYRCYKSIQKSGLKVDFIDYILLTAPNF